MGLIGLCMTLMALALCVYMAKVIVTTLKLSPAAEQITWAVIGLVVLVLIAGQVFHLIRHVL